MRDFYPVNKWEPDDNGPTWGLQDEPQYLIDKTTGRSYWNESKPTVGFKCFLLTLGTPFVHAIAPIVNICARAVRLLSGYHFWKEAPKIYGISLPYSLKDRCKDARDDLIRIALSPIAPLLLEGCAIYGMFNPYDGRKLYASTERLIYGGFVLAPCFQPDPDRHFFGGDPNVQNAY